MVSILIKNASLLVTMDARRRQIEGGGLFVRDGLVEMVGREDDLPSSADCVVDASDMIVLPGLINVHHHFSQTLTRVLPSGQDQALFPWLDAHYPIWARMGPEEVYVSALIALTELIFSGCTTTVDHPYVFPNGALVDDEIRAAQELGVRFHPCRGSMSLGVSQGGMPPDHLVEDEEGILEDSERLILAYHDSRPHSMCRVSLGPVDPESVSERLLIETLRLGRRHDVGLHIHVSETEDDVHFSLERFGRRPVTDLAERGWVGPDVWYAHCVHVNDEEIGILAETGTGVAHCPTSNMRLGSGIAPIRRMLDKGVKVGLAVDGSASNDSSHMLAEVRMSMLVQRAVNGPGAISALEALELATLGGAAVLGREDIGCLEAGKAADLIGIRLDRVEYAGAADPLAAIVFCSPAYVDLSVINGKIVIRDGQLRGIDLPALVQRHNLLSQRLIEEG